MRLYMHVETSEQVMTTMSKKILIIMWSWIGLVIGIIDFCLCYYAQQCFAALILTIMILIVILICWLSVMDLKKSYIDIDEDKIKVVEYNFGVKKVKTFIISDIKYVTYSNGDALAVKGTRNRYADYIILRDIKSRYLFKIIDTSDTRDYFKKLITFQEEIC